MSAIPAAFGPGIMHMNNMEVDDGAVAPPPADQIVEVTPSPGFDLDTYISNYSGRARAFRLKFIAQRVTALQNDAYRMLLHEIKSGNNVQLYRETLEMIGDKLGPPDQIRDNEWIERMQEQNDKALERLEVDLCQHKLNSIKEKVRMGHNDLGLHHLSTGNLNEALKCFVRTRDYGTTGRHTLEMCMHVIRVGIEMGNYSHVLNYVSKAEQISDPLDAGTVARLRVAAGLAQLDAGKYKQAALKLTNMRHDAAKDRESAGAGAAAGNAAGGAGAAAGAASGAAGGGGGGGGAGGGVARIIHPEELAFSHVIAPQDVATIGALCALATFDRGDLASKVVEDAAMKPFLDLAPDTRELINDFYNSRYSSCLATMNKIKGDLQLDPFLSRHVTTLYEMIRSRALVQYFTPYASVSMALMAAAFATTVDALQKELAQLIMKKEIAARIDSHNKIVYASHADQEAVTFAKALATGIEYERQTVALLLRLDLIRNDMAIKPSRSVHGPPRGDRDDD